MSLAKFYSHLIFHAQRPFNCTVCNLYWSSPQELEKNPFAKEPSSKNGHLCCEASLVKISQEKFNPGEIWECKWCPVVFELEGKRDSHEDEEHLDLKSKLEMKYKCLSCNPKRAYRSFKEWILHRGLEHPKVAGISCLYCDYTTVIRTKEGIGKK